MGTFQQYILSIIALSLLCHIILQITESCSAKKCIHILVGIIMLISITTPLGGYRLKDIVWDKSFIEDGDQLSAYGVELNKKARKNFIIDECESYIIKRAAGLGLEIAVDVTLDEKLVPISVNIQSNASPYSQKVFSEMIENDLGISKENQMWAG